MRIHSKGMTLVEVLIVISIIGLLAAFIVPAVLTSIEQRKSAHAASRMRIAVNAFELYRSEMGGYPPDTTPAVIPPEMTDYFNDLGIDWWTENTPIGGRWDWDNGYHYAYSISISMPNASAQQFKALTMVDVMLDDGDFDTGTCRKIGQQFHFILEE